MRKVVHNCGVQTSDKVVIGRSVAESAPEGRSPRLNQPLAMGGSGTKNRIADLTSLRVAPPPSKVKKVLIASNFQAL